MEYESVLPIGCRLEEYEIVQVLGTGGFGITYLGRDHHLDKPVAIKEYLPNDLAVRKGDTSVVARSAGDQADFEWGLDRFLEEARVLARFDHPNLSKVHRFFRAHGTAYIVMEYVDGTPLEAICTREGKLTEEALRAIILPLLDGLEQVHEASYLHRDIKPSNIVIRSDGSPVLLDFGAARAALGVKSRSVTSIVTPGYAPLEQYSTRGDQGPWTDLYALGAVLYRGLTGIAPCDATDRIRNDPLEPATALALGRASRSFLQAIDWALKFDHTERPRSIQAWRDALDREIPRTEVIGRPEPRAKQPGVRPWSMAVLAVILAVAVGAGAWWLQTEPGAEDEEMVAGTGDQDAEYKAETGQDNAPTPSPDKQAVETAQGTATAPIAESPAVVTTGTEIEAEPSDGAQTEGQRAVNPVSVSKQDAAPIEEPESSEKAVSVAPDDTDRWQEAIESDTPRAYRGFLEAYPDSGYAKLAEAKLDGLEQEWWKRTYKTNTKEAYERFVSAFPNSPFARLAKLRAKQLE